MSCLTGRFKFLPASLLPVCPEEIAERSILIDGDIGEVVTALSDKADGSDEL